MKLGILCVYLVSPEEEGLLDLHLSQIRKCTKQPYQIYAAIVRTPQYLADKIYGYHDIDVICKDDASLRGMYEHSYYLEKLNAAAIEDGVTHVVTLHLDSFPINSNWFDSLFSRLDKNIVIGSLEKINTACIFYKADFFSKYRASYLMPNALECTKQQNDFFSEYQVINHSGTGLFYAAYKSDAKGVFLEEQKKHIGYGQYAGFFDGGIFHLGGVVRFTELKRKSAVLCFWLDLLPSFMAIWLFKIYQLAALFKCKIKYVFSKQPVDTNERVIKSSTEVRLSLWSTSFLVHQRKDYERCYKALLDQTNDYLENPEKFHKPY